MGSLYHSCACLRLPAHLAEALVKRAGKQTCSHTLPNDLLREFVIDRREEVAHNVERDEVEDPHPDGAAKIVGKSRVVAADLHQEIIRVPRRERENHNKEPAGAREDSRREPERSCVEMHGI